MLFRSVVIGVGIVVVGVVVSGTGVIADYSVVVGVVDIGVNITDHSSRASRGRGSETEIFYLFVARVNTRACLTQVSQE